MILLLKYNISFCDFLPGCVQTIRSDGTGGVIKSPRFPLKYDSRTYCEWEIIASRPENKILIQLETFKIEGKMFMDDGEFCCLFTNQITCTLGQFISKMI